MKNYGTLADRALVEPVTITKNGRDRLVVISADEYARLKRRDRRVFQVGELTEAQLAALQAADMPADLDHLDSELPDPGA